MRANDSVELIYPETTLLKKSANVYDFSARQTESSRLRHIKALEHENALLTRMVSEIRIEMMRLRKALAAP
jgi:hypothetical protein